MRKAQSYNKVVFFFLPCLPPLLYFVVASVGLRLEAVRLSVTTIDSRSQTGVYAAAALLVILSSSDEGQEVMENRNAD